MEAILKFVTPASHTDLRSLGWSTNCQLISCPTTSPPLSTKNEFFLPLLAVKQSLISAPILSCFDLSKPRATEVCCQGLGFVLQQKVGDLWSLIQAGSRFLSDAETRYAVIELELLAVAWAIMKCHIVLARLPRFVVLTDHHPLGAHHQLDQTDNPRLQHLKTKVMSHTFTAKWVIGALNHAPSVLSCNPVIAPQPQEALAEYNDHGNSLAPSISEV